MSSKHTGRDAAIEHFRNALIALGVHPEEGANADIVGTPRRWVDSSSQIRGAGFGQALVVENNRIATVASTDRGQGACNRRLSTSMLTTLASMAAITAHWQRHTYIVGRGCTHNVRRRE